MANVLDMLEQYGTDLTEKAMEGKLDPVIGRKRGDGTSDSDFEQKRTRTIRVWSENRELERPQSWKGLLSG